MLDRSADFIFPSTPKTRLTFYSCDVPWALFFQVGTSSTVQPSWLRVMAILTREHVELEVHGVGGGQFSQHEAKEGPPALLLRR